MSQSVEAYIPKRPLIIILGDGSVISAGNVWDTKLFRYQLADYRSDEAERLRLLPYDKLIELKWMRRVRDQIRTDNQPKQPTWPDL